MHPILFDGTVADLPIVLHAYSTCMVLAWLSSVGLATAVAHHRGLPWRRALAVLSMALAAGIVGARVFDLWIAGGYYADEPARITALEFGGFSLYGGLLVAGAVGFTVARRLAVPVWRLADSVVPGIALGVVFMRAGCFLNGCCFGLPTELPWGVTFPQGSAVWAHQFLDGTIGILGILGHVDPVHPTQLYEMVGALVVCGVAVLVMRRGTVDGAAFLTFATGFTLLRLGNDFLRARQAWITVPEWFYPVFYLVLACIFAVLLARRLRSGQDSTVLATRARAS